jgi:hypothetical protein
MAHVDSTSSLDPSRVEQPTARTHRLKTVLVSIGLNIGVVVVLVAVLVGLVIFGPSIDRAVDHIIDGIGGLFLLVAGVASLIEHVLDHIGPFLFVVFGVWWLGKILELSGKAQARAEKERAEILRLLRALQAAVDRHPVPKPVIRLPLTGSTSAP